MRSGCAGLGAALLVAIACAAPCAVAAPASADRESQQSGEPEPESGARPSEPSPGRRALAVGASLVPGVLVHGSGNYVAGRPRTGSRLLIAEGVGLGTTLVGGVTLFLTGASRYLVGPVAALTIAGVGIFAVSFLADVHSVALPDDARGLPPRFAPRLETELGYRYVHDRQFEYRGFLVEGFELRFGRVRLAPSAWLSLNEDHTARYRLEAGWRFLGPLPADAAPPGLDGSRLDLDLAFTDHRYDSAGFRIVTGEISSGGRLDLARWDAALTGAFAELSAGYALEAFDYDVPGLDFGTDLEHLLLTRFAFGLYLGRGSLPEGEVAAYYDHRHDGFAGGLLLRGLASGIPGHFGLRSKIYFDRSFGVLAEVERGSAWVVGMSLVYRHGRTR